MYIEEAHPTDLWQMASNTKDDVLFTSARTMEARSNTAAICVVKMAIKIPAVVDKIENLTERAYTAWPDRLFIITTDGRIAYKSEPGPFGFSTRDLETALTGVLQTNSGQ